MLKVRFTDEAKRKLYDISGRSAGKFVEIDCALAGICENGSNAGHLPGEEIWDIIDDRYYIYILKPACRGIFLLIISDSKSDQNEVLLVDILDRRSLARNTISRLIRMQIGENDEKEAESKQDG